MEARETDACKIHHRPKNTLQRLRRVFRAMMRCGPGRRRALTAKGGRRCRIVISRLDAEVGGIELVEGALVDEVVLVDLEWENERLRFAWF